MSRKDKPIIEVKGLSKEYRIGMDRTYKRFTESFTNAVRHPIRTLRGLGEPKDTFWALKDVNFEVERGEVLGIIGRNGAGKSTLLKILSRITYPTEGEIVMRGRVGSLLEVGTGFHPELTGRENIYFNGAILGMRKREIDDKFDEIVKFSGVEKFLDTPVKRYSSGMNVRLAFSVAAHLDPEILLVDEVLAVGDAEFQKKCLGKMGEVASEGRTVLLVSHNMAQINKLCNKTILMQNGNILYYGLTDLAINEYMSLNSDYSSNKLQSVYLTSEEHFIKLIKISAYGKKESCPLITGETCHIYLEFQFDTKIVNPAFIISIRSITGVELMRFSTYPLSNISVGECEGIVKCILKINELQLAGGSYMISVGVSYPNIKYIIPITDVLQVEVIGIDYYKSGFTINNNIGFLVSKNCWEVVHD